MFTRVFNVDMLQKYNKSLSILLIISLALSVFVLSAGDTYAVSAGNPEYIAHRGWSSRAPENTLAAFRLASKNSRFYGVEFDVWEASYPDTARTIKDEEGNKQTITVRQDPLLLVMHDENIRRMCGVSKNVRKISRKTLGRYTIRSGNNVSKYRGQKIPTVEESLDTIYKYSNGAVPVIELKHRLSKRALKYLLKYLDGHKAVIISFDFSAVSDTVKMARELGISDNIQTMYLMNSLSSDGYAAVIRKIKSAGIDCVSLKYNLVSKNTVKSFHKSNIRVCVWTLPNKSTARRYARMGVDYITANGVF